LLQVFLIGSVENEPDIHTKIIRVIETNIRDTDNKDQPVILFRSVTADYNFPEKKPQKEHLSTEGILKHNWPSKHFELIPSVVILAVSFSVDWGATEWQRREYIIHDKYNRLKAILSPRDIKLVVVAIRIGVGSIEKDVVDERISSLKRHLPLDSKSFVFLSPSEVTVDNVYMKKISKSIRESSSLFYSTRIKQLKTVQKSITEKQYKGAVESILHARYNFKIAFYYEFQGQAGQSLRYYRLCYEALALSVETVDEELFEQVKTVAEMAHFKVCNMLLYATSVIEAFQQFRTHMTRFSKLYSEHPWKHYAWVSDQYVVFAQLLELYAVNDSLPDADRAYYYHNAARYSQKRQMSFEKMRKEIDLQSTGASTSAESTAVTRNKSNSAGSGRELYKGMVLMPPRFIGASSQILDPVLDQLQPGSEEAQRLFTEYSLDVEYRVNHGAVVMGLLTLALERTNGNFKRRKGFILSLIAEQNIKEEDYALAMRHLCTASELLTSEGWVAPSVAILGLIMKCAILLGRPLEFLNAALTLYANASHLFLSRYEIEDLHLNVMSLLEATLANTHGDCRSRPRISEDCFQYSRLCVRNKAAFLTSSFVSLIDRPEYGSAVLREGDEGSGGEERPVEFCLDEAHRVVDMSAGKKMFQVDVSFSSATVELGHKLTVRLSLTSRFMDEMAFDEMRVHFTDGAIVKHFVATHQHSDGYGRQKEVERDAIILPPDASIVHDREADENSTHFLMRRLASSEDVTNQFGSSNKDVIYTPLVFPPSKAVHFEFLIYISESGFASFLNPDAVLCLERVELILRQTPDPPDDVVISAESLLVDEEVRAVPPSRVAGRDVVFDVAAFPDVVLKARRGPGKPLSLKDVIRYCFNEGFPTVTIQKPSALISMVKPSASKESTTLLQGVVQRVNVFLKVGACDMLDGCVYLASDFTPMSAEDALFWYPDREALSVAMAEGRDASEEALDGVAFHPLQLNDAMQPSHPYSLGNVCVSGSTLFLPLFVVSRFAGAISVKLRVEYVPRGRLKSSLSKEFVVRLNFVRPLDVSHSIVSGGVTHDNHLATAFMGECSLLTTSLTCLNSLQYSLGVSAMSVELDDLDSAGGDKVHLLGGESTSKYDLLRNTERKTNAKGSTTFPVSLRKNDCFAESVYFRCDEGLVGIEDPPSSSSKALQQAASSTALSVGRVRVQWRVQKKHVLRHTCGSEKSTDENRTSWLPKLGRSAAQDFVTREPLNETIAVTAVGESFFSIPQIKVRFF
jgi:hypothetical protein